jgi:hypothetical protein
MDMDMDMDIDMDMTMDMDMDMDIDTVLQHRIGRKSFAAVCNSLPSRTRRWLYLAAGC